MIHIVDKPDECPFSRKDCDGYLDGCKYDETNCIDDDKFPDECPLKKGDITVSKG